MSGEKKETRNGINRSLSEHDRQVVSRSLAKDVFLDAHSLVGNMCPPR
nr:hypothetical protein [Candidatus Sigynarchaeum springense]